MLCCYFNSIKVQLEPALATVQLRGLTPFQFHKGTIRTYYNIYQLRHIKFQFHKGTIRTQVLRLLITARWHFNSIKVQLEQQYQKHYVYAQRGFQFHKGTIRTI